MAANTLMFIIVGKNDTPLYEADFIPVQKKDASQLQLCQFVLHSSLDIVDEMVWKNNSMFLKAVDRFGDMIVSAFVTANHVRFLLLHDFRSEDGIKNFFTEVYELYLKVVLNPFYSYNSPITSTVFDNRVRGLAKRFLS
eukprot:TRINITY_DN4467_c0_g1_i1.p1 TRINITY_DN4467_c0_g1~~TRINITY_DN4467_c0_g1_i1.p1  ORF type:complete len:139 (-),score=29.25 TRINITY_DN4467_c0_g1_i1:242-658(-)